MTNKPEMSAQEASWHEHLAGMRAAEKARKDGSSSTARNAVAAATAGPVTIGGYELHPPTEGTVWTLKRLAEEFAQWAERHEMPSAKDGEPNGTREMLELGLSTLAFCDSRGTFLALEAGMLEDLIVQADAMIWEMPVAVTKALAKHFEAGMQAIRALSADEEDATKKSPATGVSGISPAMPTQQEAVD
jgi:hypothetical protein